MSGYRVREQLHEGLLEHLMLARDVPEAEFAGFLEPDFEQQSHDPFLLPGMEAAVERIAQALREKEKICVWSDYDADGVPAGVMLSSFFRTMGFYVRHYIPHRHEEGYGLNEDGLDQLAAEGITLVITADLGTTEVEAVAHAKEKGIDVIVTDHHLEPPQLPDAVAIINPKLKSSKYPFDGLCGAGVAWKLVQAMLKKHRPAGFAEGQEKWFLDLAALGTLSDMVPLVGENRMLSHFGLKVMRRARRPGLAALLRLLRIKPHTLTEDDIGFMVSPRINAASRMDSPQAAARLLSTEDAEEALELARALNKINDERKGLVAATVKEVNKRLLGMDLTKSPLIVMGSPKWRPGILGLVASNLVEAHGKPVFLWGREGGEVLRGSCRSDGRANMVEVMSAAGDALMHFGGHKASGGFSVAEEKVHDLGARLSGAYERIGGADAPLPEVLVDRELSLAEVPHAHKALLRLAPFGIGNAKPLFMFRRVSIDSAKFFGKEQNHMEIIFTQGGARTTGIAFFANASSFTKSASVGEQVDLVGNIELDWRGSPRVRVVDIL